VLDFDVDVEEVEWLLVVDLLFWFLVVKWFGLCVFGIIDLWEMLVCMVIG